MAWAAPGAMERKERTMTVTNWGRRGEEECDGEGNKVDTKVAIAKRKGNRM